MFRKREYKKRSNFLPFVILRLCLSLAMLVILGLGVYQAFRYFSGMDPLQIDPKNILVSLSSSKDISKNLTALWQSSLPKGNSTKENQSGNGTNSSTKAPSGKMILRFAIVADSHNDNENLAKALNKAKTDGVKFVIGLGDYSEVGTLDQLKTSKQVFDKSTLPYYAITGDHDLWDSRNQGLTPTSNFSDVFGPSYQTFRDSNIQFVLLDNSDNYLGVGSLQMDWLKNTLDSSEDESNKALFVFLHEPLYHPSSDHMMGKEKAELTSQAQEIIQLLKQARVTEVFAGDIHAYSRYEDPKTSLKMTTVGALTRDRNAEVPSYIMVDVYENGGYNIQKVEVN